MIDERRDLEALEVDRCRNSGRPVGPGIADRAHRRVSDREAVRREVQRAVRGAGTSRADVVGGARERHGRQATAAAREIRRAPHAERIADLDLPQRLGLRESKSRQDGNNQQHSIASGFTHDITLLVIFDFRFWILDCRSSVRIFREEDQMDTKPRLTHRGPEFGVRQSKI